MKALLIGIQKVDFTPADGKPIRGIKIHYGETPESYQENIIGLKYDKVFIPYDSDKKIGKWKTYELFERFESLRGMSEELPCDCDIVYELRGKFASFSRVDFLKDK